ncbi:hypothetical protein EGM51_16285 [Verrucomicrobia bacterium S94]|nr:hypothetical protein EGM51_16285 [Verrucomicrobia bacterium S94]
MGTAAISKTADVFEVLSKGQFICSNTGQPGGRDLYQYVEEHEERLRETFAEVGFRLETGNNYYYFSRVNEDVQGRERKIKKALRWLDILAFFTTYRKDLCRGARLSPHDIVSQLELNSSLKDQLLSLQRGSGKKNYAEQLETLFMELRKEGFIELENEASQTWKLLDAWDYMERMVMAVNIFEDDEGAQ